MRYPIGKGTTEDFKKYWYIASKLSVLSHVTEFTKSLEIIGAVILTIFVNMVYVQGISFFVYGFKLFISSFAILAVIFSILLVLRGGYPASPVRVFGSNTLTLFRANHLFSHFRVSHWIIGFITKLSQTGFRAKLILARGIQNIEMPRLEFVILASATKIADDWRKIIHSRFSLSYWG